MAAIWNNVFTLPIVESIYIDLDCCIITPLLESLIILTQHAWLKAHQRCESWAFSLLFKQAHFESLALVVPCCLSVRRWGVVSGCQSEHELILPAEEAGNYPSSPPLLCDSPSIRPGDGALSKPCMRQLAAQDSATNESVWGIEFVIVREA